MALTRYILPSFALLCGVAADAPSKGRFLAASNDDVIAKLDHIEKRLRDIEEPFAEPSLSTGSFSWALKATVIAETIILIVMCLCVCCARHPSMILHAIFDIDRDKSTEVPWYHVPLDESKHCCSLIRRRPRIFAWVMVYFCLANLIWMYLCTWKVVEVYFAQGILVAFMIFLLIGALALIMKCVWPILKAPFDTGRAKLHAVEENVQKLSGVMDAGFHERLHESLERLEGLEKRFTEMTNATKEEFQKLQETAKEEFQMVTTGVQSALEKINDKLCLDEVGRKTRDACEGGARRTKDACETICAPGTSGPRNAASA